MGVSTLLYLVKLQGLVGGCCDDGCILTFYVFILFLVIMQHQEKHSRPKHGK